MLKSSALETKTLFSEHLTLCRAVCNDCNAAYTVNDISVEVYFHLNVLTQVLYKK